MAAATAEMARLNWIWLKYRPDNGTSTLTITPCTSVLRMRVVNLVYFLGVSLTMNIAFERDTLTTLQHLSVTCFTFRVREWNR